MRAVVWSARGVEGVSRRFGWPDGIKSKCAEENPSKKDSSLQYSQGPRE